MTADVKTAAREWSEARAAVIEASIYPIGNAAYRAALDRLSEAEHALARAVDIGDYDTIERRERIIAGIEARATAGVVTAEDLSLEFDVSPRTIYRYMQILRERGVRVLSESGYGYLIRPRKGNGNGAQNHL